jgi:RNA polymerase sigma factor (sigma-70 family)
VNPVAAVRRTSAPDGVLVQEAAAGGGASYAALYDRYAEQVYNYCLRLTGSPDDAADATQDAFVKVLGRLQHDESPVLDFASYLFTAARNESYALMRRRSRTQLTEEAPEPVVPVPDVETDPERALLLQDSQETVRKANARLAPRHREVLALREVAGRSYDEIGEIMGISENAAAQLIWRARAKLKGALTAGAVASVVATSEDCETAQILINRLHDHEPITDSEHLWLDEHLDECARCRAARGMIFDVAASYRAWAPVAVLAALRPEVLTHAGAAIGADWSGVAAGGAHAGGGHAAAVAGRGAAQTAKRSHMVAGSAVGATVLAVAGIAISALLGDDEKVAKKTVPTPPTVPKAEAAPKKSEARPVHAPAQIVSLERAVAPPVGQPATKPAAKAPQKHASPPREEPMNAPRARPAPKVERPAPAPRVAPTRPAGPCSWPGHGNGPSGCPPGHGGVPPGRGGTPPGRGKVSGRHAKTAPSTDKIPPGHGGTPPGHAKHG